MDAAAAALYKEGYAVAPITLKTRHAALAAARRFFELPDAVKRKAIAPKRQATHAYSPQAQPQPARSATYGEQGATNLRHRQVPCPRKCR